MSCIGKTATSTSLSEPQQQDEMDHLDLRDVSEGYIIKVTKSKFGSNVRTLYFHFPTRPKNTSDTSSLLIPSSYTRIQKQIRRKSRLIMNELTSRAFDFTTLKEMHIPSKCFRPKPEYDDSLVDLVFPDRTLTIAGRRDIPGSIDLVNTIIETGKVYLKNQDKLSPEEITAQFIEYMDDNMFKTDKRAALEKLPLEQKLDFLHTYALNGISEIKKMRKCLYILKNVAH